MIDSVLLGDIFRFVNIVISGGVAGLAALTVVHYAQAWHHQRRLAKMGHISPWRGLLPRHVTAIGVSYLGLVLYTVFDEILPLVNEPFTYRAPLFLALYGLGLWAMWDVFRHARHRKHLLTKIEPPKAPPLDDPEAWRAMLDGDDDTPSLSP